MPMWAVEVSMAIAILYGLLECFFGYKLLRIVLGILGFVTGLIVGWLVALAFVGPILAIIAAVIGGILGALLFILAWLVGVFALGAMIGAAVAMVFTGAPATPLQYLIVFVPAAVLGTVALLLQRHVVIIITSLSGAWTVVASVYVMIAGPRELPLVDQAWKSDPLVVTLFAVWSALSAAGLIVQYKSPEKGAKAPKKPKVAKEAEA
jgi:hypothetical protein